MITLLLIALAAASPAQTQPVAPKETVIHFAANGGISNIQPGPPRSNLVYLQDRRLQWYRVTLTDPCLPDRTLQTVTFTTDVSGTFDRFSRIGSLRFLGRVCGVTSIVESPAPPGQPKRG